VITKCIALQTFPEQSLSRTDVSRTSYTKEFSCIHNVCLKGLRTRAGWAWWWRVATCGHGLHCSSRNNEHVHGADRE